jgi:excisionase family DNA binding protein
VPELTFTDAELDRLADVLAERVAARLAPRQPTGPELLSVAATAKALGVSPDTVRRRIAEGALPALHEGDRVVVRADELCGYIDGLERIGLRPGRAPRGRATRRFDFLHD